MRVNSGPRLPARWDHQQPSGAAGIPGSGEHACGGRELHARIARDETRHAALSLDVATWAAARLPGAARQRMAAASRDTLHALHASVLVPPAPALLGSAGLP